MSPLRVVTAPHLHGMQWWQITSLGVDTEIREVIGCLPRFPTESQVPSLETVIYLGQAPAPPRNFTWFLACNRLFSKYLSTEVSIKMKIPRGGINHFHLLTLLCELAERAN